MMAKQKQMEKNEERVYGPLDYLLTGIYAVLAAYAAGRAVGSDETAYLFSGTIILGTAFSFLVQLMFGKSRVLKIDGYLYLAVALSAWIFRDNLNALVPDQVFSERPLYVAGFLCWMLAFGSFFTWRDGTLLFQAIPGIALFGMVGVFDTYAPSTFLFYIFLTCLATMFARAHLRTMLEQAERSGYKAMLAEEEEATDSGTPRKGRKRARQQAIFDGPWKWMAGPEWALISAIIIIVVSLIGAPVAQASAKGISGVVQVPAPRLMTPTAPRVISDSAESDSVRVGLGRPDVGDRELVRANMDQMRYLRARTYNVYTGQGWNEVNPARMTNQPGAASVWLESIREMENAEEVSFWVEVLDPTLGSVPVPGEFVRPGDFPGDVLRIRRDGTIRITQLSRSIPRVSGRSKVNPALVKAVNAPETLPTSLQPYLETRDFPREVLDWAREAAKDATTDFDKAQAVKRAIESTAMYNLQVPPVPAGEDPIAYFLFQRKQGYCDDFASSMVAGARAVGIPARYTTGFYPMSRKVDDEGNYILLEKDSHAWAELFFAGYGWVVFDATEFAQAVPGGERGGATKQGPWYEEPWVRTAVDVGIVGIVVVGGITAFFLYRRARNIEHVTPQHIGREYARFVSLIERATRRRRMPFHTPDEYLALTSPLLGGSAAKARDLNGRFVTALYSPVEITPEQLFQMRADVEALRQAVKQSNGNGVRR